MNDNIAGVASRYQPRAPEEPSAANLKGIAWALLVLFFGLYYAAYFSPVLARGGTLAPGDGEIYYLSYFQLPILQFWNDSILSGFPVIADIQAQTLYPLRWLSPSYNVLVVSAYVVCAVGTFGLAFTQTGSRMAGLFAAIVVSGSGFMLGHLGHLGIIHSAAWVPALLWALASLSRQSSWGTVGCGALAVAMCVLGGHPQISVIGLLFSGIYALAELAIAYSLFGRRKALTFLVRVTAMFALGLAIASPALIGTLKSAVMSVRGSWGVGDFNSYSHDWWSLRLALFPHIYGGYPSGPYDVYSGPPNSTELAMYAGILPWLLACFALPLMRGNARVAFWALSAVCALLLCLGTLTPLGKIVYHLPLLGSFRAQSRFAYIAIICVAMLAAHGLSCILRGGVDRRHGWLSAMLVVLVLLGGFTWLAVAPPEGLRQGGAWWMSRGVFVSLVMALLSSLLLILLIWRRTHGLVLLSTILLAVDLGGFGWFYEWRYGSPQLAPLAADTAVMVEEIKSSGGRLMPLGAQSWPPNPLRPNINMRFGLPSVVGYGPLLSARYAAATGADTVGGFPPADGPLLDVLGVQWVAGVLVTGALEDTQPKLLGAGCGVNSGVTGVQARLPAGARPTAVRVVSHMSCSETLSTHRVVAELEYVSGDGKRRLHPIEAGVGTGEWAWDRADIRPIVAHTRPHVIDTFSADGARGLWFGSVLDLPGETGEGRQITVVMRPDIAAPFQIRSIDFQDAQGTWHPIPFGPTAPDADLQLGPVRSVAGLPQVSKRLSYRGNAWAVCSAQQVSFESMPALLRARDQLDPFRTGLIEKALKTPLTCSRSPTVTVAERRDGFWHVRTRGEGNSLLVLSGSYDDGWRAEIDGKSVPVVPVFGLVMGVEVPGGAHQVVVRYSPKWLNLSLVIAGISAFIALLLATMALFSRRRRPQDKLI
jgi:hypothetical protein